MVISLPVWYRHKVDFFLVILSVVFNSNRRKGNRTGRMDESKTAAKSAKQSQPRGAKLLSKEKSNKEASAPRDDTRTASRRQENLNTAKNEDCSGGRGPSKTLIDTPQDKRRGRTSRLTRLTGRTSSGERGKGKTASSHHQLVAQASDSRGSHSADNSPLATREPSSLPVPDIPKKGLKEQARNCKEGLKSVPLMHQSVEEGAEVRTAVEEGPLTEQQLGLRQAEERLYRDYIHRLLKVKKWAWYMVWLILNVNFWICISIYNAQVLWLKPRNTFCSTLAGSKAVGWQGYHDTIRVTMHFF